MFYAITVVANVNEVLNFLRYVFYFIVFFIVNATIIFGYVCV